MEVYRRIHGGSSSRCPCCGSINSTGACCLMAPDPKPWCAWCGEDLDGDPGRVGNKNVERQVFCGPACASSYHQDLTRNML